MLYLFYCYINVNFTSLNLIAKLISYEYHLYNNFLIKLLCNNLSKNQNLNRLIIISLIFYTFSIGRVLKDDQYLVRDSGLQRDLIMPVLLSMVSLPHLH